MVRCAYCGAEGKMSREHVIPKGFINNMDFKALTVWLAYHNLIQCTQA